MTTQEKLYCKKKIIDYKLSLLLIVLFIMFVPIGALSHELGHYIAIKSVGLDAEIKYCYTKILHNENYHKVKKWENLLIAISGPIQSMIIGLLGLLLLAEGNQYKKKDLKNYETLLYVLMSLFWSRSVAIFLIFILAKIFNYKFGGDEAVISSILNVPVWSVVTFLGLAGLLSIYMVIFKFLIIEQRVTFVFSLFMGSILGFFLWMFVIGKILLP